VSPRGALDEAYRAADEALGGAVRGLVEFVRRGEGSLLDGDFESVRARLEGSGLAVVGSGAAATVSAALADAAAHPLLGADTLRRARKVILSLTVTENTAIAEVNDALVSLLELLHDDADLLWNLGIAADPATALLYATNLP
jgi:cell division GTPase FtsZ